MAIKESLVYGDRNFCYFHQVMKARKSRNKIIKIKDFLGVWVDDSTQLQQLFVNEFKEQFKSLHAGTSSLKLIYQKRSQRRIMTSL